MKFVIEMPPACSVCGDRAMYYTGVRFVCWDHYTPEDWADIMYHFPNHYNRIAKKQEWGSVIFVDPVTFDRGEG